MMKKFAIAFVSALALLVALGLAVTAQQEVPAPYAGLANPFAWDDAGVQQAGKKVYQQSCAGCHGLNGASLAASNFSEPAYADGLEAHPDLAYWILSEGRMDRGMPPYKSSLSEEQRWQALTYIWSLGRQAPPPPPGSQTPAVPDSGASLRVAAPKEARPGQAVSLAAYLRDAEGKAITGATVRFFARTSFFTQGLMELGDAETDETGTALLKVVLREAGEVPVVARYGAVEAATALTYLDNERPFYETEVGIRMPGLGADIFVGPVVTEGLGEMGSAPGSILRLPAGTATWLLLLVLGVLFIWGTYFFVAYQVLHISVAGETGGARTRSFPYALLAAVALAGLLLALKLLAGPYSQFHLFS
ncbi:MAG: c-type cytochrome [Chloroflexi bacterium]|nr:c-type cytochrome [Chloroflexota bacterium]